MNVFITGASSGIGRALALLLIKEGHTVWVIARRKEELLKLRDGVDPTRFFYSVCDASDAKALSLVKSEMREHNFSPDAVIAGAAVLLEDLRPQFNASAVRTAFDINFFGAFNVVNLFLDDFLKRGQGHFIALSSILAFRPDKRSVSYSASKSALSLFWRGMDLVYRSQNVVFSTVYLGPVATDMRPAKSNTPLVISPETAARKIASLLDSKKSISYIPFLSTTLYRTFLFLPDRWLSFITEIAKKII